MKKIQLLILFCLILIAKSYAQSAGTKSSGPTKEETIQWIIDKLTLYTITDWCKGTYSHKYYYEKIQCEQECTFSWDSEKSCFLIHQKKWGVIVDDSAMKGKEEVFTSSKGEKFGGKDTTIYIYPKDVTKIKTQDKHTMNDDGDISEHEKMIFFDNVLLPFDYNAEPNLTDRLDKAFQHLRKLLGNPEPKVKKESF